MSKNKIVLCHVVAWLLYTVYCFVGIYIEKPQNQETIYWLQLSFILCMVIEFYYCYLLVYPLFLNRERLLFLVVAWAGAPLLFILFRYLLEETLYPVLLGFSNYGDDTTFEYIFFDNLYYATPMVVLSLVVWSVQEAFRKEKENKLLRQEKTQAELAFLKSQVNPHFLYNTLNYLYAQAYPVSEKLADAILKLSDMMRYMLHESPDGKVALEKEVNYLRSFIDIFRLRFEDRFFVDFTVDGHVDGQQIGALVLIPFVENAFKHGVADDPQVPIHISLIVMPHGLKFTVTNRISGSQKDQTTGIGLNNIRRRLELLYPHQHELLIKNDGQVHEAYLELSNL
ncbi:histidine kinase [Nibribacter ruber]|uniref:Histidine kinase n=1 Tax=Nibribacter ruber TaxID=2698458 RepID=A0A6P1P3D3_9BACT|nr:histidine kinase [Nibribacter ruber]QHL88919.1 histidine kinase [Nibribacter ruber]